MTEIASGIAIVFLGTLIAGMIISLITKAIVKYCKKRGERNGT